MHGRFTFNRIAVLALIAFTATGKTANPSSHPTPVWNRWEQTLTSAKSYENPCQDVVLSVTYSGPDGAMIRGHGFWDGGDTFKIRTLFPTEGQWEWHTGCSDPANTGLQNQRGTVRVCSYTGSNPLYQKGYLKVSANRRYLEYGDGTPFLWIGDTAWAAPMHATRAEWESYVNDRQAKNFTMIQIFCSTGSWTGSNKNRNGHAPFLEKGVPHWNPAYWQDYENMVQYANDRGIAVTVVGLMEPVDRYPEKQDAVIFARNLTARLMGNFVLFSPSFDSVYMELGDAVGEAVRETASLPLITQHPGTDLPAARNYYDKPYLDFCGLQSGAGWGSNPISPDTAARNAVEWTLDLYRRTPWKPIVNLEARYDSEFNQKQLPRLPRSCGYWTLLSGACGYTYGCAGVWFWGHAITGNDPQADMSWNLQQGIDRPSSLHMKYMADFFSRLSWWKLEPAHDLIVNQVDQASRRMVLAKTPENDLAVAYLPDNPEIHIRVSTFSSIKRVQWFNPQTGELLSENAPIDNQDERAFQRPKGWEDALLVLSSEQN